MPLYEFKCDRCGVFDQWRSLAESSNPAYCPDCSEPAKRIFSPPMLLSPSLRLSKQVNPEPQVVQRMAPQSKTSTVQSHPNGRPWMLSH